MVACGGGGGGASSGATSDSGDTARVALSRSNYLAVAQEVFSPAHSLSETTGLATGVQSADTTVVARFVRAQIGKVGGWMAQADALATGVVHSDQKNCDGGGTLRVSLEDRDGDNAFDVGDAVTLDASACRFEGQTLDGRIVIQVDGLVGSPEDEVYAMTLTIRMENLQASTPTVTTQTNGSYHLELRQSGESQLHSTLRADNVRMTTTRGAATHTVVLSDYSIDIHDSGTRTSKVWGGRLQTSVLPGETISLQTTEPLVSLNTEYPTSGSLLIRTTAGGVLRVTPLSPQQVRLDLDADGDGVYEESSLHYWKSLY